MQSPKLRTVEKYAPPFPLNKFPKEFPYLLGREIVYLLATRVTPRLEGPDWEEIFARLIGGRWKLLGRTIPRMGAGQWITSARPC